MSEMKYKLAAEALQRAGDTFDKEQFESAVENSADTLDENTDFLYDTLDHGTGVVSEALKCVYNNSMDAVNDAEYVLRESIEKQ